MAVVCLREVSKSFWVSHEKPALVRGLLPRLVQPLRQESFWALRDLELELAEGTALGVIGPNGAGKTTLLSVIAGITPPTTGTVRVRGQVAALLTLGSGFHHELTGLENIFLNGSLLGMTTREIRRKLEAIVAFSQLDGFIDAPLQTYSAGMKLRLGFAIAIHTECDILVVDEVMRVGDAAFQAKCLEQLLACKRAGKTLLLAGQDTDMFKALADRALLLHQGRIIAEGTVDHVQERYTTLTHWLASVQEPLAPIARLGLDEQVERRHNPSVIRNGWGQRQGTGEAQIEDVRFVDATGRLVSGVDSGTALTVVVRFTAVTPLADPHIGVAIFRDDSTYCYGPNTRKDGLQLRTLQAGTYECRLHVDALHLTPGSYRVSVSIWDVTELSPYTHHMACYRLRIMGAPAPGVAVFDHRWRHLPSSPADAQVPRLVVEGPQGGQAWYRTFEPLTFTVTLPPPQEQAAPTLRAECRGPRGELWWTSRWSVPSAAVAAVPGSMERYELHIPQLLLLTGRYHWLIGWVGKGEDETVIEPVTAVLEVFADRADHGVLYLPHSWELRPCEAGPNAAASMSNARSDDDGLATLSASRTRQAGGTADRSGTGQAGAPVPEQVVGTGQTGPL